MLDDGFKLKCSVDLKKVEGKEKNERYWRYPCEFSVQTAPKRNIQYATPEKSYIQIWLKTLVTVFGSTMQTNYEENLYREEQKFGNVKMAHFALFSSSFWNTKEC